MTLDELSALLAIAYTGGAVALVVTETRALGYLRDQQLIEADGEQGGVRLSERGRVFVDHILALPLPVPVSAWRMPSGIVEYAQPDPVMNATEALSRQTPPEEDNTPPAPPRPLNFRPGNPIPTDPAERSAEAKRLIDSGWGVNEVATQLEMAIDEVEAIFFEAGT